MTSAEEKGRVVGTLGVLILVIDGLCDSVAPSTGSDVLTDTEFEQLMAMADRLDRLMSDIATRR